jgi:hypothetical protein
MQTLGLADAGERSDSRLKSLFWPSVQSGADVDYLGAQGYWICTFIAVVSFIFSLLQGRPFLAITLLLFFYFGGVGVRQRDPLAAGMVFLFYAVDTLTTVFFMVFASPWGMIVFRIFVTALLLSNIRATWIASKWKADSEEAALPPRLNETWSDKFADQLPAILWPKARIAYYIFGACVLTLVSIGLARMLANLMIRGMS